MTVLPTTVWIVPPPGTFDDAGTSGMRKWALRDRVEGAESAAE